MMNRFAITVASTAVAAVMCVASSAAASTIFTDSFETPVNDQNWQVYPDTFGDWSSYIGTGIEVQRSGVVVDAQDGNQYIELDSDSRRGGDGTASTSNSSMTRVLDLSAGTYQLDWYYQARTYRTDDNLIEVFLSGASQSLLTNLIGSADGNSRSGWSLQTNTFTVDGQDNLYALTFIAGGLANTLGGFIDNVTLTRISSNEPTGPMPEVPLPAGLPLMLAGAAALGLAGRRKKR